MGVIEKILFALQLLKSVADGWNYGWSPYGTAEPLDQTNLNADCYNKSFISWEHYHNFFCLHYHMNWTTCRPELVCACLCVCFKSLGLEGEQSVLHVPAKATDHFPYPSGAGGPFFCTHMHMDTKSLLHVYNLHIHACILFQFCASHSLRV